MGAEIRGEMQLRTKDSRLAASTGKRQERSHPESWSETARWYFGVLWRAPVLYVSCSVNKSCLTLWDPMDCSTPGFPVLHCFLEFSQSHVHWIDDAIQPSHPRLILCCPLLLLPSTFPSIRVFSNESALCIRWSKYWSFSSSISPSNEYLGLISFSIDWFDLPLQGIFKSLLQHHSLKVSNLRHSDFFIVWLSHPYMTTGKIVALTRWTFVGKVMSVLFNTLSRFIIAFLPRGKHLLISWLQSLSTVILEPKRMKSVTICIISLSICHEVMGTRCHELQFLNVEF